MPFAGYENFADCVRRNSGKSDPKGYCAAIMRRAEGKMDVSIDAGTGTETKSLEVSTLTQQIIRDALASTPDGRKVADAIAAKCGWDVETEVEWKPFGGAQSFVDLDAYVVASHRSAAIHEATYQFEGIVANIMADDNLSLDQKARRVAAVAGELETRIAESGNEGGMMKSRGLFERFRDWLGGSSDDGAKATAPAAHKTAMAVAPGVMTVFKDADGRYRYIAVASNRYEDKDGEIFSAAAHREYVAWANATKMYPELWLWHTKGSRMGVADAIAYDEDSGFRVSTGTFDRGMEKAAEALMAMPSLAMSHGYFYDEDDLRSGVYEKYRTFEESVLPSAKIAANDGTAFAAMRRDDMGLKGEQRAFFVNVLGEAKVAEVESGLAEWAKDFEEAGVRFKAIIDGDGGGAPAADPPGDDAGAPAGDTPATGDAPAAGDAPAGDDAGAAGDDAGAGDGAAAGDAPAAGDDSKAIVESLKTIIAPVTAALEELATWRAGVDERLGALGKSAEDTLADLIRPRAPAPTIANPDATPKRGKATDLDAAMKNIVAAAEDADELGDDADPNLRAAMPLVGMLKHAGISRNG